MSVSLSLKQSDTALHYDDRLCHYKVPNYLFLYCVCQKLDDFNSTQYLIKR